MFAFFLAGLMIPAIFTLLPNFVLIKQLGLVDTLLGIALPTMLMTPFAVFFLRQFFLGISARGGGGRADRRRGQGPGVLPAHPPDVDGARSRPWRS